MQSVMIKIKDLRTNKGQIEGVPTNPRLIKDAKFEKLKKSLQDDPEMMELREIPEQRSGSTSLCLNLVMDRTIRYAQGIHVEAKTS